MKKINIILILFLVFTSSIIAQDFTVDQIFKNMKDKFNQVNDYTAEIEANVNLEKIRMPKVKITVYFKQPDKYHYESKNFALLPKGGINFNPLDYSKEKYSQKLLGKEILNNTNTYKIEVIPKESKKNMLIQKTYLWVDIENFVVKRIVNEKENSFKSIIDFTHKTFENKYYLPSLIKITYETIPSSEIESEKPKGVRNFKYQKGDISLTFTKYLINTGLNDDIFIQNNIKK